jgi:hypothetical protein
LVTEATAPATAPRTAVLATAILDGAGGSGFARRWRDAAARAAVFFLAVRLDFAGRLVAFRVAALLGADLRLDVFFLAARAVRACFRVAFFANLTSGSTSCMANAGQHFGFRLPASGVRRLRRWTPAIRFSSRT